MRSMLGWLLLPVVALVAGCGDDAGPAQAGRDGGAVVARDGGGTTSPDGSSGADAGDPPGDPDGGVRDTEVFPSIYPLELVLPRAAGTAPSDGARGVGLEPGSPLPAIPATHRVFRAYPGIEYDVRAAVIGGSYPYTFSLRDAPASMTIDPVSGQIHWPSPDADATPTIVVTDMEGTEVSSPWTIEVTTAGFRFVDSADGEHYPAGTGTLEDPYRDFVDLKEDPAAGYGDIVYFRNGVYGPAGIERDNAGGAWERVDFGREDPQTFLAYPGERPILDFGFVEGVDRAAIFRLSGGYVDGFETRHARNIGFQLAGGNFTVLRRLDMHDHNPGGEELDGQNPAHVMSIDSEKWYTVVQDCDFHGMVTSGGLKLYNEGRMLIEGNRFYDGAAGVDWKVGIERGTFRGNRLWDVTDTGIYGNMSNRYEMFVRDGEIAYNLFLMGDVVDDGWDNGAVGLNWDSEAGRIDVYRNTIVGRSYVARGDAADGPFRFARNVMITDDPEPVVVIDGGDPARTVLEENLVGTAADGIVDEEGRLTEAYAEYRGTHGHEVSF
jgi:hypothetical protein